MSSLDRIVAAHPLVREEPYSRIKFAGVNQHGRPVYTVGKGKTKYGADKALREAHRRFGGNCFHCREPITPGSDQFTLDHLRPKKHEGGDHLHNLVFACRACNWSKAGSDLASFEARIATEYLNALNEHLVRCIRALSTK
jgi:5-methylcytosine-specific restriction endonuclease McrA